jgi:hypothetical protein
VGEVGQRDALAFPVDGARRAGGAGRRRAAVHHHGRAQRAQADGGFDRLGDGSLVRDVGVHVDRAVAEFLGQGFAAFVGDIGDDHLGARRGELACGGAAEAARAAGDER